MIDNFMKIAIEESKKALLINEIPVGAVVTKNNIIIGKGYNKKEKTNIIIDHAEIVAINKASKTINNWRLNDCYLYTTLFPCLMCATVIQQSRIKKVFYIVDSNNEYEKQLVFDLFKKNKIEITKVNINNYDLINEFFNKIR